MSESTTIRWERDEDGIVVLTLDDPNRSANTMNAAYKASMAATVDRLEAERDEITGVVITSAKNTFFAGGDLHELKRATKADAPQIATGVREMKRQLRRLETLGKPVAAAINGAALGGGLEICLACHHRVALDDPKVQLGFPEVQLGLLPGGGGVARTVRMLGLVDALMQLLLQGQRHRPAKAKELGIVDELVATRDELVPAAKAWVRANPEATQPWDVKGHKIPGGTPSNPKLAQNLPAFPANLRKQLKGAPYPAPHHIMAAAVEGAQVDFDNAIEIEGRYFVNLVTSPQDHDARPPNGTARRSGHFIALKICARGPRSRFIAVGCAFVRLSGGGRRVGRARIVVVDALGISEHEIDGGATVFFFARAYTDDRSSGAAYERGRAKISKTGNTSLFRVRTPDDGRHILFILCGTLANAKRARERVAWGGAEYDPTPDEIAAIASRFREVAEAGALNSASSWGGAGGLGLGREGSRGPIRRPQG